ncbi:MAG: hypothetical protein IIZ28_00235 [Erysipelotrichaceae bacterium]|nr:hypothetical protein [Erysipelotrichaceae bacterium]
MEKKDLKFIFVHGLSGWGSYDERYARMPYWGMRNGDLMRQLKDAGFDVYCASVSPQGSAYDRACELYAQLAGEKTDYGIRHCQRYGHERFGPDFTSRPLIDDFGSSSLVLLGHSFGGATIRMFARIMEYGIKEECTEGGSSFFAGGMKERIFALVCLAAPHNGTTAYDMYEDESFDPQAIKGTLIERLAARLMSKADTPQTPLPFNDCAAYDMHIDNAMKLNAQMPLSSDIYYFSQPCRITRQDVQGNEVPDARRTEVLYSRSSKRMGAYSGKTRGGLSIDERWRANDGLVNTLSSMYPSGDPHCDLDEKDIRKGIWNVLKTYDGDHMSLQGGLLIRNEVFTYYKDLLSLIGSLN